MIGSMFRSLAIVALITAACETTAQAQSSASDRMVAEWLKLSHQEQVQLGELALPQLHEPETRGLAQRVVDRHRKAVEELSEIAPGSVALTIPLSAETVPANDEPPIVGDVYLLPRLPLDPGFDVLETKRQLSGKYLAIFQREMASASSNVEKTATYLEFAIKDHEALADAHAQVRKLSSPRFSDLIKEHSKAIQTHIHDLKRHQEKQTSAACRSS